VTHESAKPMFLAYETKMSIKIHIDKTTGFNLCIPLENTKNQRYLQKMIRDQHGGGNN
jgi:hypothetical protein